MVFAIIAARRGAHWALALGEAAALGESLDAVLAKYLPDGADKYAAEIGLIGAAAMIVMPRLAMDSELAQASAEKEQSNDAQADETLADEIAAP